MNTLEKLHKLEKAVCIYNIHYAKAGVGFCFYYPDKDKADSDYSWKEALETHRYYKSFEEAVDAEYKRCFGTHPDNF